MDLADGGKERGVGGGVGGGVPVRHQGEKF